MDPYLAMMGQPVGDHQRQAMARLLREQGRAGGALSTSSIDTVADQGARMQESALGQAESIGLQKARQDRLNSEKEDRLLRRALKARELANEEDDYGYKISPSERKEARQLTDDWRQQTSVLDTWDPSKQTKVLGGLQGALAQRGINIGGKAEDQQAWWAEYRELENQLRNEMFGSALTAHEAAAWAATAINRSMDPETVKSHLESRQPIIQSKAAQRALVMMAEGHKPRALKAYFRGVLPAEVLESEKSLEEYADRTDAKVYDVMSKFGDKKSSAGVRKTDLARELERRGLSGS